MFDVRRRLFFLIPMLVAALVHNIVHETTHYLMAILMGEPVTEFRLLTNGFLTSQVIFATPTDARTGPHWLLIAWAPAVVTTLIGVGLFLTRRRWLTRYPMLNAGLWFATAYFLLIDPFYFAVLSIWIPGTDVAAAAAVGWSPWPVRIVAAVVLAVSIWLFVKLRRESNREPERYLPASQVS